MRRTGLMGGALLTMYEMALRTGLDTFIASPQRDGWLAANKEGLCSLAGYISLYMLSERIGQGIQRTRWSDRVLRNHLVTLSILLYSLHYTGLFPCSRRMANAGYVIWVLALCCGHLAGFLTVHMIASVHSVLLEGLGRHQLLVFLAANLLTGLLNMLIQCMFVGPIPAIAMVFMYTFMLVVWVPQALALLFPKSNSKSGRP